MSFSLETLTYNGNAEWRFVGESDLDLDSFGFDTLTRTYEGRPDKLAVFLRDWPKNKQDRAYPWLFLVGRKASGVGSGWVRCVLEFKGTLDRNPKPHFSSDTRLQPLQIQRDEGRSQAEYYGPVSTYRYIVVGPHPRERTYAGQMLQPDFAYEIINVRGQPIPFVGIAANRRGLPREDPSGNRTLVYLLEPRIVTSRFSCEQVGNCWQVTEENEGRLEPPGFIPTVTRR